MQDQIGRYEIRREIGRGGMATVYLAFDPRIRRQVAIKVLPRQFTHDPKYLELFEQEAHVIASLEDPAIVPVHDFGEQDDAPYLVMRYMPGGSLRDRLSGEALSLSEIAAVLERIASALDYAHRSGVIHRDLKPSNIFFDDENRAYLADFGIARLAEASRSITGIIGTPAYMSPEQVLGKAALDGRSDIYALGVVLFEMLTGSQPFVAETDTGQMFAHVHEPIPDVLAVNQDLPPAVKDVVNKALAKERDERYATAEEVAAAFSALLEEGETAEPIVPIPPLPPPLDEEGEVAEEEPAAVLEEVPAEVEESGTEAVEVVVEEAIAEETVALEEEPPEAEELSAGAVEVAVVKAVGAPDELHEAAAPEPVEKATAELETKGDGAAVVPVPEPDGGASETSGGIPRWLLWVGALLLALLAIFGIRAIWGGGDEPDKAVPPEPAREQIPPQPADSYLARAFAGEFSGSTVTVMVPVLDEDLALLEEDAARFTEATGINVHFSAAESMLTLEGALFEAYESGNAPDIVDFSWIGLLQEYAAKGAIVDVTTFIAEDALRDRYDDSFLKMATVSGPDGNPMLAGVWHRFNGKSYVWYPKQPFEEKGYPVPGSYSELLNLTQRIAEDGGTAWCIGIEAGIATGWVATDWTEEMMLRVASLEEYDAWVKGELPFASPQVHNAVATWSDLWFNPAFTYGGRDYIMTTSFFDAPLPMFEDPPDCWLHKQGDFITGVFPAGKEYSRDYGVFYFPAEDRDLGRPMLIVGDIMAMFNDREEVRAVMEYFTMPESVQALTQRGTAFSPHKGVSLEMYGDGLPRDLAAIIKQADSFRFDASDQMPSEVGTGSFWHMMTAYVAGEIDLETALREIDATWPR